MNNINIQRILIPVDFLPASESAVEYGAYIAKVFSAEILLLHILEGVHTYPTGWFTNKNQLSDSYIRRKVHDKFSEYAKSMNKKYSLSINRILTTGRPANKIADTVEEHDIDLIVMGTHGASGFEEFFLGHTAHKVVNISPCPVITIREGFRASGIKNIVLPIDESLYSRQKVNHILPIASGCKSVVHILGIIQSSIESDIAKFNIKLDTVEKSIKKAKLIFTRKVVIGSNIAIEAMNYAEEVKAEMLAIMTDHESNMSGTFMGAFAQQIVNHSKVPILSIKPIKSSYNYPT
jgi:nucleotide-binding universal stress UspA family protein